MDIRKLRYFSRIIEFGSISRASADLYVAQPALSKAIRALEDELGVALLERSPQGVTATEAGRRLYEHAQIVAAQIERARMEVTETGGSPAGLVTIGMTYSLMAALLVPLLRAADERLPKVRLQMFQEPREALPQKVLTGKLEFAVLGSPMARPGLCEIPVVREPLHFVCHRRIARRLGQPVDLEELSGLPLILPTRANSIRVLIESLFLTRGLQLNVVYEVDAISHFIDCVQDGLASTFLPAGSLARALAHRPVQALPLKGDSLTREIVVAHATARPAVGAARHVEELLHDVIRQTIQARR